MPKKKNGLTPKQERFALNLFQGMSQREAYVRAGYSANMKENALDVLASRLAGNVKVSLRLTELQKSAEDASVATVLERKQILTEIARAKLVDFVGEGDEINIHNVEHNTALSEFTITYTKQGEPKKTVKLHDPVKAIAELNRMERIGAQEAPQTQINILNINAWDMTDEQLIEIIRKERGGSDKGIASYD